MYVEKQINTCRICGSSVIEIHRGTRDRKDINVYECVDCHTKQLDIFGENDYSKGFMNDKLGMTPYEIESRLAECATDDERRANYFKSDLKEMRVLDFGCGFGGFLKRIKESASFVGGLIKGVMS